MENMTVYIAPRFFEQELKQELEHYKLPIVEEKGRLFLVDAKPRQLAWAQNTWLEPFFMPIDSVGDAAKKLKAIQRNWHNHPIDLFRRAKLIEEKLPPMRFKPHEFGQNSPNSPLGAWALWDNNTLLLSARCSSAFAHGECLFMENKIDPPSRAYLKLWETFTLSDFFPKENELAIDLGACPGGWTWVMAEQNAKVFAIDKSPLDPKVAAMSHVDFCKGSGFALEPKDCGEIDWLLSDMACYPERLYDLAIKWINNKNAKNIIFTVKLQGSTDHAMLELFKEIENSSLLHLCCNKHELTWIYGEVNLNYQKKLDFTKIRF